MTQKDINEKIRESSFPEWFKNVEVDINITHLGIILKKKGFLPLYQYISRQKRGWDKITGSLPTELENSKKQFNSILEGLEYFLNNNLIVSNEKDFNYSWTKDVLVGIGILETQKLFTYDSPLTSFLLELNSQNRSYFTGALKFFNSKIRDFNSSDIFEGAIKAYEFKNQAASNIVSRKRYERSSNSRLRNNFENFYSETEKNTSIYFNDLKKKSEKLDTDFYELLKSEKLNFEALMESKKKEFGEVWQHYLKSLAAQLDIQLCLLH